MARKNLPSLGERSALAGESFTYEIVAEDRRDYVRQRANRARHSLRKSLLALIETGQHLNEARPHIPHGYWTSFIEGTVEMSLTWAADCMALHRRFVEQRPDVLENELLVAPTAMIHLARAPDAAIDEVLKRSANGERLIIKEVDAVIGRHNGRTKRQQTKPNPKKKGGLDDVLVGEEALAALSDDGIRQRLIPKIIDGMQKVLGILEDAEELLASGRDAPKKMVEGIRETARWLTDGLEQVTQLRADTDIKLVHTTYLERRAYPPGPWADAAAFLADCSTSQGWERMKKDDIPDLVRRGLKALRGALLS